MLCSSHWLFCGGRDFLLSMLLIHRQSPTFKQLLKVPQTNSAMQEKGSGTHFKMGVYWNLDAVKDMGYCGTWEEKELSVSTKSQREHLLFLK